MSNETQNTKPKFKLGLIEILGIVFLGLSFVLYLVHLIVWQINTAQPYFTWLILYSVLALLGLVFLIAFRKKDGAMALLTALFIIVMTLIFPYGMVFGEGLGDFYNAFQYVILLIMIFLMVMTLLPFFMKNKFTEKAPMIVLYVIGPVYMLLGLIYFLYTLIYGFRNYDPLKTIAFFAIGGTMLHAFLILILGLPFLALIGGHMQKKPVEAGDKQEKEENKEEDFKHAHMPEKVESSEVTPPPANTPDYEPGE